VRGSSLFWTASSFLIPALLAVVALPQLLSRMGPTSFGILSTLWVLGAALGIADLGFSRAFTQRLAAGTFANRYEIQTAFVSVFVLMLAIGGVMFLVGTWLSDWLLRELAVPEALWPSAKMALAVTFLTVPVSLGANLATALSEATFEFRLASVLRAATASGAILAPYVGVAFSTDITWLASCILGWRLCVLAIGLCVLAHKVYGSGPLRFSLAAIRSTWTLARWVSVSNIFGAALMYGDRLLVGSIVGVTAIASYNAAFELTSRTTILAVAFATVFFPVVARSSKLSVGQRGLGVSEAMWAVLFVLAPLGWLLTYFGPEIRRALIPVDDTGMLHTVWALLVIGAIFSSLGQVPFVSLQGLGRSRAVALTHLGEVVPYLLAISLATSSLGTVGAALAWCCRALVDAIALDVQVRTSGEVTRLWLLVFVLSILLILPVLVPFSFIVRSTLGIAGFLIALSYAALRAYPMAIAALNQGRIKRENDV